MNANNSIPFDPKPDLFRKKSNNIIKKTSSSELKLEIIFFGEIVIDGKKYYRYACYNNKGKIQYLELKQTVSYAHFLQSKWERGENSLLIFSSSRKNTRQPHARQKIVNRTRPIQNFSGNPVLVVQKIPRKSVNDQDFMNLLENLNNSLNISKFFKNNGDLFRPGPNGIKLSEISQNEQNSGPLFRPGPNGIKLSEISQNEQNSGPLFRPDPNGIKLSELEKTEKKLLFKIIRKSTLFSFKFNEPIILFGGIIINGKEYYEYCCYKSSDIGSENGVSFRKLSNDLSYLKKFRNKTKTNINNGNVDSSINNRTYLYYIQISDIPNKLLRELSKIIESERITKKNQSLYKTIYNQVHRFLYRNNVQTNEEGIQLQNMGPNRVNKRIAFNGNPKAFMKEESDNDIKKTFSEDIKLIPFFGEIEIDRQKYYKYACYVIDGVIYFITLQQPNNRQNKLKVVIIDRKYVNYDLQDLFKELNSSLNLLKSTKLVNMYKTSISEMCRLLDISFPNNNKSRRNHNL